MAFPSLCVCVWLYLKLTTEHALHALVENATNQHYFDIPESHDLKKLLDCTDLSHHLTKINDVCNSIIHYHS